MIKTGRTLPAAVTAGALFLAAGAPVAQAETAPLQPVKKISEKQQLRNEQARTKVVELAKLIMRGPAAHKGGQQNYTNSLSGERFGVGKVDVPVNSLYSELPGKYSFRVTAPLSDTGRLKLNRATSVNMTEGDAAHTYVSSNFSVSTAGNNSVAFHGSYISPKGSFDDFTELAAVTDPDSAKEARLTPKRLAAAAHQAGKIIVAAEHGQPTGALPAPFAQPPGTRTEMH